MLNFKFIGHVDKINFNHGWKSEAFKTSYGCKN